MRFIKTSQKGDTIVEVLIAIAVLAFALGMGYATANRSNVAIQSNKERYQAQLVVNKQVEYLRAGFNTSITKANFGVNAIECVTYNGTVYSVSNGAACDDNSTGVTYRINTDPVECSSDNGVPISKFCTYKITVDWDSLKGGRETVATWYGL